MKNRPQNCPLQTLLEGGMFPPPTNLKAYDAERQEPVTVKLNPSDCVTINLFSQISGLTPAAVRNMIHEGKWLEGRHYFRRAGRVYVSVKGYEKWVQTGL